MMDYMKRLFEKYPPLKNIENEIKKAFLILCKCYENGGKLLICGNGGSASDAEHIVGELMKGFYKKRPISNREKNVMGEIGNYLQGALPAIALTGHPAFSTAFLNDVHSEMIFAQQVYGYAQKNDVFLGISTSGNSNNVINAVKVAKAKKIKTIGLSGFDGGELKKICDVCIVVPGKSTADIQEYHLPVYHTLCAMLEEKFFDM